jgi:hypothetical protein
MGEGKGLRVGKREGLRVVEGGRVKGGERRRGKG